MFNGCSGYRTISAAGPWAPRGRKCVFWGIVWGSYNDVFFSGVVFLNLYCVCVFLCARRKRHVSFECRIKQPKPSIQHHRPSEAACLYPAAAPPVAILSQPFCILEKCGCCAEAATRSTRFSLSSRRAPQRCGQSVGVAYWLF